jgi:hypothetical protein
MRNDSQADRKAREILNRRELMRLGAAGLGAAAVSVPGLAGATARAGGGEGGNAVGLPVGLSESGRIALQAPDLGPAPRGPFAAPPIEEVKVGYVGTGLQGSGHVRNLMRIPGCRVTALCDNVPEKVERWQQRFADEGLAVPTGYTRGDWDFVRMCEEEDLDLVYTATPWEWHVPVMLAAMENGKHAATEIPAAYTVEDCWKLVEAAETHEKHCVMMENCNYDRPEMMVFNMVRQGLFGEILHAGCGYLHDLRGIKFEDRNEGLWRREHSILRNGNLYPTHGLGPIANCVDIDRGDRMEYLVSMSSPSRGLQLYALENFPEGDPKRDEQYALGDVNSTLIKTAHGRTIHLVHDTNLPRPYSRIHMLQGTKGIFHGYPNRVYFEGHGRSHRWIDETGYEHEGQEYTLEKMFEQYEHPLIVELREQSEGAGHGGMDYVEDYRLIKCLNEGLPTDTNVYQAASISAVCELTEISVANGSMPVEFPDFTRGRWRSYPRWEIVHA